MTRNWITRAESLTALLVTLLAAHTGCSTPPTEEAAAPGPSAPQRIGYGLIRSPESIVVDAEHLGAIREGTSVVILPEGRPGIRGRWGRFAADQDSVDGFSPEAGRSAAGFATPDDPVPDELVGQYAVVVPADSLFATGETMSLTPVEGEILERARARLFPGTPGNDVKGSLKRLPSGLYGFWAVREGDADPPLVRIVEVSMDPDLRVRHKREEGPFGPDRPRCADVEAPVWADCCDGLFPKILGVTATKGSTGVRIVQRFQCLESASFWVVQPLVSLEREAFSSVYTLN